MLLQRQERDWPSSSPEAGIDKLGPFASHSMVRLFGFHMVSPLAYWHPIHAASIVVAARRFSRFDGCVFGQ